MKQRKIFCVLIAFVFVLSIFGCAKNGGNQNSQMTKNESNQNSQTTKNEGNQNSQMAKNDAMKIGLITDLGGINDHSFNQLSYEGLKSLQAKNPSISISYLESKSFSDYDLNIDTYVNEGCDLIITVGATFIETLKEAAKNYPEQKFAITGVPIGENLSNVACLTFANEEGAYLCGVAAAMMTKTNNIGYIQGIEIDSLNLFGIGYIEGAKSINEDINVFMYNANNFADIIGGNVAATNMIKNDADIIYHAAGATGIGVINACTDNKVIAIGNDSDQSVIAKDTVALSSIQKVDKAVYDFVIDMQETGFKSGIIESNIENGKINIAYNDKILPKEVKEKLEIVKKDIISKKIKISKTASECPDFSFSK